MTRHTPTSVLRPGPLSFVVLALAIVLFPTSSSSQRSRRGRIEDTRHGLSFEVLRGWEAELVKTNDVNRGLIYEYRPTKRPEGANLYVCQLEHPLFDKDGDLTQGARIGLLSWARRRTKAKLTEVKVPDLAEEKPLGNLPRHHYRFEVGEGSYWLDAWLLPRERDVLAFVFMLPTDAPKRYLGNFEDCVDTYEPIEQVEIEGAGGSYEETLAYHRAEVAPIAGWRVVGTPSKKFVIKTSHEDEGFVEEVIERLERSRALFEEDYPPPANFTHVSIVRLCGSEDEFHEYGNTRPGVAGWFNPRSTELVLYDAQDIDRRMSFAVMSHEAFHQYCHFLFGAAEAHRWFDEGHGDYYGGAQWSRRGKLEIERRMPAGLDRMEGAKAMVRDGSYAPLRSHLNFSHREWQTQGPTRLSGYEQSWSIVYMLRQGALGNVHRKVWREEYATILPNYIAALKEGFATAFEERREGLLAEAKKEGETIEDDELEELVRQVPEKRKKQIWEEAFDASWGKIDLSQFEEDWRTLVKRYL